MTGRLAAVDIGTNTTLLAVAEPVGGTLVPVFERAAITRLGRDLSRTGVIGAQGLAETRAALASYVDDCRRLGATAIRAVGTAAMRNARNRDEVSNAFREVGVEVDIITGDKEAALTFLSAVRDFGTDGRPLAVIDVGGGSTEVILGDRTGISWRRSFPAGVVRLKERLMPSDPPTSGERDAARREAKRTLDGMPRGAERLVVAVAGTPTTLAAIKNGVNVAAYSREAVHGTVLTIADLDRLDAMIAPMRVADRLGIKGLESKRADVIDAGIVILSEAMRRLDADSLTVSDGGVRWGLLWKMLSESGQSTGDWQVAATLTGTGSS
ncbi:MAG: Ppx/GppA family phosphatase [Deltaproteobacteria bacterium]|nr:Ppx/GppA family phosphatase [Deltaproteobacteria bacterium]